MSTLLKSELPPATQSYGRTALFVVITLAAWAAAVVAASLTGGFAALYQPVIGAIVAATIVLPTLFYFASSGMQSLMHNIGQRRILQFHIWRIPAALLFFWYGVQGVLPTPFWVLAGVGDLIAGSYALLLAMRAERPASYLGFHLFGFADFVVAVGTGLTFTLLLDPRMAAITTLPLALIPLFGVGISGATHLIAFDMLGKGKGLQTGAGQAGR
jgi:hypothetical protein